MTDAAPVRPKIGDTLLHPDRGQLLTIREFPAKIGHAPGAVYEAFKVMDVHDELKWQRAHFRELVAKFQRTNRREPTEEEVYALSAQSNLRPTETLIPRGGGEPFQKPREMRLTGLVADLRWDRGFKAWRPERRQVVKEIDHPERRSEVSHGQ